MTLTWIGVAVLLVVTALIAYNRELKGIVRASANFSGVNQVKQASDPYISSSGVAPPNSVADTPGREWTGRVDRG